MDGIKENKIFDDYITLNKLHPIAILNTHCHFDHVLGFNYLKERYNLPIHIHELELPVLDKAPLFGEFFGLKVKPPPPPDFFINEGDIFKIGNSELQIFHVPGHSEGSIALYAKKENILITGDVLFQGSIGRTDLPGGDYATLINSIENKLMILSDVTNVFPGHGQQTSIENERKTNPFLI
jgi:glyoxylase-like metal-dependent hydrolase (beta-lactamase superfamily II)